MPTKTKTDSSEKNNVKICPHCGNEIKSWAKKCVLCKKSLIEKEKSNNLDYEIKQEKKKKTKRIWWWILALSIPIIWITWLI